MTNVLSSAFKALAASARAQESNQLTTTVGKIIRLQARTTGVRIPLKKARGALKELSDEGYIDFGPAPPGKVMLSPFNRPILISLTDKGHAYVDDLGIDDQPPDLDDGRPDNLIRLDLASMNLPPKAAAIMDCLRATCEHYKKRYCFPSQDTIRERCRDWYKVKMSARTLNRWLSWLEAAGWIRRVRRPHLAPDGKWKFHSTLYELAGKVWTWAKKQATKLRKFFGVFGLPQMAEYNLKPQRVIPGGDSSNAALPPRFGEKGAPSASRLTDEDRQANILRLGRLVATVFKN